MNAITPGGLSPDPQTNAPKARGSKGRASEAATEEVRLTLDPIEINPPADSDPVEAVVAPARPGFSSGEKVPPQLAGIEVRLSVEVGGLKFTLKELMEVQPGQLFPLDRMTSEPVSVLVNGKPFASGEIVAVGERFGVRLIDISGEPG